MQSHIDAKDSWDRCTLEDHESSKPQTGKSEINRSEQEGSAMHSKALYEKYGTNEPYTELDDIDYNHSLDTVFKLVTGPSTNFYVGPQETHYTIPKRLLYHFSDHAKKCLESNFQEANANAVWLPDVDPDIFQWLLMWLYTGELKVLRHCHTNYWNKSSNEQLERACLLLCRMHFLGERVLFDDRLLRAGIQYQLDDIIEEARSSAEFMPLTPEIIEEVLSESASVRYGGRMSWASQPLRPLVLRHLCTFQFCTEVDFMDYVGCFENDGAFAAEIMEFMKSEIEWAVKRWEADVEQPVDAAEKEQQFADEEGVAQWVATRPRALQGVGLVLRYFCTFAGCTKTDFRAYSQCFELDGEFAAEILNYMVEELLWIVEMWGRERGWAVDIPEEKEEEERVAQEESDLQHMVDRIMRRDGWS